MVRKGLHRIDSGLTYQQGPVASDGLKPALWSIIIDYNQFEIVRLIGNQRKCHQALTSLLIVILHQAKFKSTNVNQSMFNLLLGN